MTTGHVRTPKYHQSRWMYLSPGMSVVWEYWVLNWPQNSSGARKYDISLKMQVKCSFPWVAPVIAWILVLFYTVRRARSSLKLSNAVILGRELIRPQSRVWFSTLPPLAHRQDVASHSLFYRKCSLEMLYVSWFRHFQSSRLGHNMPLMF